jgi:hypothetical protein
LVISLAVIPFILAAAGAFWISWMEEIGWAILVILLFLGQLYGCLWAKPLSDQEADRTVADFRGVRLAGVGADDDREIPCRRKPHDSEPESV